MIKNITIFISLYLLLSINTFFAQTTYISGQDGDWSATSTWRTFAPLPPYIFPASSVPIAGDLVYISDNNTVTVSSDQACNKITLDSRPNLCKLIIDAGAKLTIDTIAITTINGDNGNSVVENSGRIVAKGVKLIANAGTSTFVNVGSAGVNNGRLNTQKTIFDEVAAGTCNVNLTSDSQFTTKSVETSNTAISNTTFDLSSGNGRFRIREAFTGANRPTIIGGVLGSKVEYVGNTPQVINSSYSSFVFDEIRVSNAAGASLDAPITLANLNSNVKVVGSGIFNQNGHEMNIANDLTSSANATINSSANITTGNRISNLGTFNTTGGNIVTGQDLINKGTFNTNGTIIIGRDLNNTDGTFNANGDFDITRHFINTNGTFTSSGSNLNVERDWSNGGGTYTFQTGDIVTLDGTGGNSYFVGTTNFYELVIDKSGKRANVGSGDVVDITSILDVDAGDFRVTGTGEVTLLSNASGTAQLDEMEAGADYIGALNVQRFLALGNDGWREVTSPVSGTSLSNWQDDGVIFTGFTGANFDASNWYGWVNSYTYVEGNANGVRNDGWVASSNTSDATSPTSGHRIYMGNGGTLNLTLAVKGNPNKGLQMISVSNGGGGSGDDQNGWNLIGNPYPCTIDWNSLATSNIDGAYWIWNATAGNYGIYQNGAGTGTNGVDSHIAHSQAFWVHCSAGSGSIFFSEGNKVRNDKAFVKSSVNDEFVRVKLSNAVNTYYDEAIILFNDNATTNYDNGIDQNKLYSELSDLAPSLAFVTDDNTDISILGMHELKNRSIPVKAFAGTNAYGTYTIDFEFPANTLVGSCVTLEDLETGAITNLKSTQSYTFTTTANSPQTRFVINISQPFEMESLAASCSGTSDGEILVEGQNINGETFTISQNTTVIASTVANGNSINFENLPGGLYTLQSTLNSSCGQSIFTVEVPAPIEVESAFSLLNETLYLSDNATVNPQNNSNGTDYSWDFGDGTTSNAVAPSHTYTSTGTYTITLIAENSNGCTATSTQQVVVETTTGVKEQDENNISVITVENGIEVSFIEKMINGSTLNITDLNGKLIKTLAVTDRTIFVNTASFAKGLYFVTITNQDFSSTKKIVVD